MCCLVPHLHTVTALRSWGLVHPQYRFIALHSASYAPLHSSRKVSAAPCFFSGCSFAQPSGFGAASLIIINYEISPFTIHHSLFTIHDLFGRFTLNQGTPSAIPHFKPAVLRCYPFTPLRKLRFVLGLPWLFDCRNPATALLAPQKGGTAGLGGVYCRFQINFPTICQ